MYLSLLKEEQKELFLDLAYQLALTDGIYGKEENKTMEAYSKEMDVEFRMDREIKGIDYVIGELEKLCDEREKKIIVFEAIGLALSDNHYDVSEKEFIFSIIKRFDLKSEFGEKCEKILNEYINFQRRVNELIIG